MWARKTIDSEIFYDKPAVWFKIWFFLINRVNYQKTRKWRRGQCFTTYQEIMESCKASYNEVHGCVKWLKKEKMLSTQKSTRGFHITIMKYGQYQNPGGYNPETNLVSIQTESTLKEKNDNKDNKYREANASYQKGKVTNNKHMDYIAIDEDGNEIGKLKSGRTFKKDNNWSWSNILQKLQNSPLPADKVLAHYFDRKGTKYSNQAEFEADRLGFVKVAKQIAEAGINPQLMEACMDKAELVKPEGWTIHTVRSVYKQVKDNL